MGQRRDVDPTGGIDLASAVAAAGRCTRGEVACIAAVVAAHLADLHDAGAVHGSVTPAGVVLTGDGPVVLPVAEGAPGAPEDDVRAWAAIVHLAAVGRPLAPGAMAEPDDLDGVDLAVADLLVGATRPIPDDRPSAETLVKVVLGGRRLHDPWGEIDELLARSWPRDVLERVRAGGGARNLSTAGGRRTAVLLVLVAVLVVALVVIAVAAGG